MKQMISTFPRCREAGGLMVSALTSGFERSRFEPWLGTLFCVAQDT